MLCSKYVTLKAVHMVTLPLATQRLDDAVYKGSTEEVRECVGSIGYRDSFPGGCRVGLGWLWLRLCQRKWPHLFQGLCAVR